MPDIYTKNGFGRNQRKKKKLFQETPQLFLLHFTRQPVEQLQKVRVMF